MSRLSRLRPLAGLLAAGLVAPAFAAPSQQFPTYTTGLQPNGSYVVSNGQIITPAGTQVNLGIRVRAKAIALNPIPGLHTAAVLTMGATAAVQVFDTLTGEVLQSYLPYQDSTGSYAGIAYSADGKYLMLSQDSGHISIASVGPTGLLTDYAHISAPGSNKLIKCFPNSPIGPYDRPCGMFYSTGSYYTGGMASYPGSLTFNSNETSAYALLNDNDTLATISLTGTKPVLGKQVRVGNAPHTVVLNGTTAYVSNEGGRVADASDFTIYSAGTEIVANPINGSAVTGTVSVVDTTTMTVTSTINVGLHPTGEAIYGGYLLVANTYSDTISVINMATNKVVRTIDLGLPVSVPGSTTPAYGAAPVSIAVDAASGIAYVALYNANAIAVVNLAAGVAKPITGLIPTAYAPASVVLDKPHNQLIVANDKGIGTLESFETDYGVTGYNTHQDNGTVSIVPVPDATTLAAYTLAVHQNDHWDLEANIKAAGNGSPLTAPVAIPAHIGDPSLIKHVFLIIRENRTYDQMLGDVKAGNGDPELAVFGASVTPNMHKLVERFPLLDNFYDPSRQSADGHQWIQEALAPYQDDIQAPDWIRSYPGGNAGDSLAYQPKGFLFQESVAAGLYTKIYGEYVEEDFFPTPLGQPSWQQFYQDSQNFEAGMETTLQYQNAIVANSTVPAVENHLVTNFPQFDLNIPDQFRVDLWLQDFQNDLADGTVPALSILWVMCDHTGGELTPSGPALTPQAEQADNDLAVGRIIDTISHSNVWKTSAIFIEEDDAQNGVDHVDGHRSPGYVVSPYAVQNGPTDHTYYTQVNMTRTIEQILGLTPLNQFDLLASPMFTDFTNTQHAAPWDHVPNKVPLDQTETADNTPANAFKVSWLAARKQMFAGKITKPDSEDPVVMNYLTWYEATDFKRPFPGDTKMRTPSDFKDRIAHPPAGDDD
jgi:YVTN family beta-propeller protein